MPIKDSLGSFRQLSISEGYTPPNKYWVLQWQPSIGVNTGSITGSYFSTTGNLYLSYAATPSTSEQILKVDEYGQFRSGQSIQFPTSTASPNINTPNTTYTYSNTRYTIGYESPTTSTVCTQTSWTHTPFGNISSVRNQIYSQFSSGNGEMIWPIGGVTDFNIKSYKADSIGYTITLAPAEFNATRFGSYVIKFDLNGNTLWDRDLHYSGTNIAYNIVTNDTVLNSSNQTIVLSEISGTVTSGGATFSYAVIFFISSIGTIVSAKQITYNSLPLYGFKCIIVSGFVYMLARQTVSGTTSYYLVKFDALTGSISSSKSITGFIPTNINTDVLNPSNIIISGDSKFVVINTGMTINYQRQITFSSGGNTFDINSDGVDSLYIAGKSAVLKTPSSGTILNTGTYTIGTVTITYQSISNISIANISNVAIANYANYTSTTSYGSLSLNSTISSNTYTININSWNS